MPKIFVDYYSMSQNLSVIENCRFILQLTSYSYKGQTAIVIVIFKAFILAVVNTASSIEWSRVVVHQCLRV